jgi:mono/diheme cytochrome c family protein
MAATANPAEQTLRGVIMRAQLTGWLSTSGWLLCLALFSTGTQANSPDGRSLFQDNCQKCHKEDGRLSKLRWQDSISNSEIIDALDEGPGKMPSFTSKLNQAEYQALVSRIRELRQP